MSEPDTAEPASATTADVPTTSGAVDAPLLEVDGLRKEFGGVTAVDGASFRVAPGSLTGLIGPNGAGKSTTFNCITGIHEPTGGTVRFDGQDVTGLASHTLAKRGLVRTFQIARELSEMTVLENVMLAPPSQRGESVARAVLPGLRDQVREAEREVVDAAWETLDFFEIAHLATRTRGRYRAASGNCLRWPACCRPTPRWCCWTNRSRG